MALRMCSAHATSTSADGKQEATVFALSHSQGETRLWYAIETINPATRLRFIALDIVREEAREVTAPPVVSVCDQPQPIVPWGCSWNQTGHSQAAILCHIRFAHRNRSELALCPVRLHWAKRRITVRVAQFCPTLVNHRAVHTSACVPFFVHPDPRHTAEALDKLKRWVRSTAVQVGRIHLHVLNQAALVKRALAPLAETQSGLLQLHAWTYFEDANLTFSARSNVENAASANAGTCAAQRRNHRAEELQLSALTHPPLNRPGFPRGRSTRTTCTACR